MRSQGTRSRRAALTVTTLTTVIALVAPNAHADPGRWVPSFPVKPQGQVQLDLFEDGTAFAYNNNDVPFWKSTDFGQTWTPLPLLPAGNGTPDVDFGSPDFGVVRAGNVLFESRDEGATWLEFGSPTVPPRYGAEDQWATPSALEVVPGSEKIVLAGEGFWVKEGCPVMPTDSYVWTTEDPGGRWRRATVPYPGLPIEIEFLNERYGLVLFLEMKYTPSGCGHGGESVRSSVLLTTDGGRTFREIHSAWYEDEDPIQAVAMPSRERIVLGTGYGRILLSTNQGRTFREVALLRNEWDEATGSASGFTILELVFGTKRIGYAATNGLGTWRTEDGGETWFREPSHQSLAGLNLGDVVAAGSERALAGGAHAIARRVTDL